MSGCPGCGSARIKAAPGPLPGAGRRWSTYRRYRCADCGWTGWKHRLRRRGGDVSLQERRSVDRAATVFAGIVVLLLAVTIALLARSCDSSAPRDITALSLP